MLIVLRVSLMMRTITKQPMVIEPFSSEERAWLATDQCSRARKHRSLRQEWRPEKLEEDEKEAIIMSEKANKSHISFRFFQISNHNDNSPVGNRKWEVK
jgi:hypothetical protein